ncbi:hypothetical protein [Actinoplanes sp. NPDC026619]|uniref:hypothetical protein n=1 Tax=Actinoplanes sp. NPDC026619 TaxID=3155798 RepID=UPI0033D65831
MHDCYDRLDADPQVAEDLAYLDAFLGVPPPAAGPGPAEPLTRVRFDVLYTRAQTRARARTRRGNHRRRLVVGLAGGVAAVIVATAGLIGIESWRSQPAYAATPAPLAITPATTGSFTLAGLARIAAGNGDDAPGVDHLVIEQWDLNSIIDGQQVNSAVIPARHELWRAPDDRARTVDTYLSPQFPTAADRQTWEDAGSPRGGRESGDYPPQAFVTAFAERTRPPADPARLAAWLSRSTPSDSAVLTGAADLLSERALTGGELSALLRVLSSLGRPPAFAGLTTDRAGRSGAAFTVTTSDAGAEITHVLVIDTVTGRVLATEQILVAGATALGVHRPAVIGYRTYRVAERIPEFP